MFFILLFPIKGQSFSVNTTNDNQNMNMKASYILGQTIGIDRGGGIMCPRWIVIMNLIKRNMFSRTPCRGISLNKRILKFVVTTRYYLSFILKNCQIVSHQSIHLQLLFLINNPGFLSVFHLSHPGPSPLPRVFCWWWWCRCRDSLTSSHNYNSHESDPL